MKYLVLIPDGMADEKIEALGNLTPMQKANKPCMDELAKKSTIGTVLNVPEGMVPESDTANMAILSFDPKVYSKGRSPLEAVSMGIEMKEDEVAYRCNVVSISEEGDYDDKIMLDHSADEITTEEARELIETLDRELGNDIIKFYTGVSYRHCIIWKNGNEKYNFSRPHDIIDQPIKNYLPHGEDGEVYYNLMRRSYDILSHHPVNEARRARGLKPANSIWLWSPGKKPALPSFSEKWGLNAAVISAVDLIKGIGLCAGMKSIDVEGATGNVHTNYDGKANAAINAFKEGADYVYVHVEGPDECGHRAEIENKVRCIELIDEKILTPIYEYLKECGEDFKIMILPDHPTPTRIRTHTSEPVPFMIYSSQEDGAGVDIFCEDTAAAQGYYVPDGYTLMDILIKKNDELTDDTVKKNKFISELTDYVEIFTIACIATLLIFTFVARNCNVVGDSMNNTLYEGQKLIISNFMYTPNNGDIVVFHQTGERLNEPVVKRVIATEGQKIKIDFSGSGTVYVDDKIIQEDYVYLDIGEYFKKEADYNTVDHIFEYTVPKGQIFVMGDNRNNSLDSRSEDIGPVDCRRVLGKVLFTFG